MLDMDRISEKFEVVKENHKLSRRIVAQNKFEQCVVQHAYESLHALVAMTHR